MRAHHENDPDYNSEERASGVDEPSTVDMAATMSAALTAARAAVDTGIDRLRDAYARNPTRTVTLGLLSLAGLLAVITTLTRRN